MINLLLPSLQLMVLLLLLQLPSPVIAAGTKQQQQEEWIKSSSTSSSNKNNLLLYPHREITLRAGMMHSPPQSIVEVDDKGIISFTGMLPELLKHLQLFAARDNVTLKFIMTPAPTDFNDAIDLIANDCPTSNFIMSNRNSNSNNNNNTFTCNDFDVIIGDFYSTAERSTRVEFTGAFLTSGVSAVKYTTTTQQQQQQQDDNNNKLQTKEYSTFADAQTDNATVCLSTGGTTVKTVTDHYPSGTYIECHLDDCFQLLMDQQCVLYADDALVLRSFVVNDPLRQLEMTREQLNTLFLGIPLLDTLPSTTIRLFKKWMYLAVDTGLVDDMYARYYRVEYCPVGTAGMNCDLPCDPDHGTADARGKCICQSTKWSGDDCSVEVPEDLNMIPLSLKYIAYTMFGVNVCVIGICSIWLFWQRTSVQVQVSQPFFLMLVLLGCFISSSTILAMAQEDNGNENDGSTTTTNSIVTSCTWIPWLYSIGFCITFGTLFAKILRVYRIFTQRRQTFSTSSSHRRKSSVTVTFQETIAIIGLVLLIDVIILLTWTIFDPLQWERSIIRTDQFGIPLESEGYCTSESWKLFGSLIGALHFILQGVACYLCYVANDIPTKFQEGKYVSIAMLSNLQIFIVGVPILIIVGSDPQSSFFVRSCVIWMNDLAVVTLIFGNLIYSVHMSAPEESINSDSIRAEIGKALTRMSSPSIQIEQGKPYSSPRPTQSSSSLSPTTLKKKAINMPSPHLPKRRDEVSSLNMESSTTTPMSESNYGVTNAPWGEVSSLTMWSTPPVKRSRSVSWGMDHVTEGDDEENGQPSPDLESARFNSMPCHGAPNKPNRHSFSSRDGNDDSQGSRSRRPEEFVSELTIDDALVEQQQQQTQEQNLPTIEIPLAKARPRSHSMDFAPQAPPRFDFSPSINKGIFGKRSRRHSMDCVPPTPSRLDTPSSSKKEELVIRSRSCPEEIVSELTLDDGLEEQKGKDKAPRTVDIVTGDIVTGRPRRNSIDFTPQPPSRLDMSPSSHKGQVVKKSRWKSLPSPSKEKAFVRRSRRHSIDCIPQTPPRLDSSSSSQKERQNSIDCAPKTPPRLDSSSSSPSKKDVTVRRMVHQRRHSIDYTPQTPPRVDSLSSASSSKKKDNAAWAPPPQPSPPPPDATTTISRLHSPPQLPERAESVSESNTDNDDGVDNQQTIFKVTTKQGHRIQTLVHGSPKIPPRMTSPQKPNRKMVSIVELESYASSSDEEDDDNEEEMERRDTMIEERPTLDNNGGVGSGRNLGAPILPIRLVSTVETDAP